MAADPPDVFPAAKARLDLEVGQGGETPVPGRWKRRENVNTALKEAREMREKHVIERLQGSSERIRIGVELNLVIHRHAAPCPSDHRTHIVVFRDDEVRKVSLPCYDHVLPCQELLDERIPRGPCHSR